MNTKIQKKKLKIFDNNLNKHTPVLLIVKIKHFEWANIENKIENTTNQANKNKF